jgi:outer membrane murein-binding lipoprotein Lpp
MAKSISTRRADVHFVIPNIISANLAERCGTEPITSSAQELNARVEALKQLREITLAAEQAANGSNVAERKKISAFTTSSGRVNHASGAKPAYPKSPKCYTKIPLSSNISAHTSFSWITL